MSFALGTTVAGVLAAIVVLSWALVVVRGRAGGAALAGLGRGLTMTTGRALALLATLVSVAALVAAAVCVARIAFVVLHVNTHNEIVVDVRHVARMLAWEFRTLFLHRAFKVEVGINYGIAAGVYLIVGRIVSRTLRRLAA